MPRRLPSPTDLHIPPLSDDDLLDHVTTHTTGASVFSFCSLLEIFSFSTTIYTYYTGLVWRTKGGQTRPYSYWRTLSDSWVAWKGRCPTPGHLPSRTPPRYPTTVNVSTLLQRAYVSAGQHFVISYSLLSLCLFISGVSSCHRGVERTNQ